MNKRDSVSEKIAELFKYINQAMETNPNEIDCSLEEEIKEKAQLLKTIKLSLLKTDLIKIFTSKTPSKFFLLMDKLNLLKLLIPELDSCKLISQNIKYHKYNVFEHCIYTMDNTEPVLILRLAALLHDIGKVDTCKIINNKVTFHKHEIASAIIAKKIMKRFSFSSEIITEVVELTKLHMFYYTKEWSDHAVRRFIKKAKFNINNLNSHPLFKIRRADRLGKGIHITENEIVTNGQKELEKRILKVFHSNRNQNLKKDSVM